MKELIFDIGMHVGQDTKYYLEEGYKVVAIEANPVLVVNACKKFNKYIATGQLKIVNVGIAESEGKLPFYRNLRLSEWSSFNKGSGTRNGTPFETLEIQCTTIDNIFRQYGVPYYMKIDIEGNDYLCLSGISDIAKPKFVSCEAGSLDCLDLLVSKGYSKFKLISQLNNFNPIDLKRESRKYFPITQIIKNGIKLRVQKVFPIQHPYGSSGPFGEESKGEWKSYNEIRKLYLEFYNNGKPLNKISWFDFHATY